MKHALTKSGLRAKVTAAIVLGLLPAAALAQDPLHPLGQTTIQAVVGRLIGAVLGFTGIITLLVFIWSGFSWMISAGNADKIKVAKRNMVYAITGMIVCFGSYAMLNFIFNTVIASTR